MPSPFRNTRGILKRHTEQNKADGLYAWLVKYVTSGIARAACDLNTVPPTLARAYLVTCFPLIPPNNGLTNNCSLEVLFDAYLAQKNLSNEKDLNNRFGKFSNVKACGGRKTKISISFAILL